MPSFFPCRLRRSALAALAATFALSIAALPGQADEAGNAVTFTCSGGKSIDATFFADRVELKLSDGRSMDLPQTMSGSGIRYANADESFVFWSKGDTAFVTEGGNDEETYADCVTAG